MTRQTLADLALVFVSIAVAVALVALGGCAIRATRLESGVRMTIGRDPALDAQCAAYNRRAIGFTATAVALGGLGAATGIPAMLSSDTPRWVTGSISAVTSAGAAVFTTLANLETAAYARSCAVEVAGSK